jgi:hypothetical protein
VTDGETLYNFRIVIQMGTTSCTWTIRSIVIEPDGSFMVGSKSRDDRGEVVLNANTLIGKFESPTKLTGHYSRIIVCGTSITLSTSEGTFNAEWASEDAMPTPSRTPTRTRTVTPTKVPSWTPLPTRTKAAPGGSA